MNVRIKDVNGVCDGVISISKLSRKNMSGGCSITFKNYNYSYCHIHYNGYIYQVKFSSGACFQNFETMKQLKSFIKREIHHTEK